MPASPPCAPAGAPGRGSAPSGPSRARAALLVVAIGAATFAGLLLQGRVSVLLLATVVLALGALTLGTWHRLTVPGRALRVLVLGLLAATAAARLTT